MKALQQGRQQMFLQIRFAGILLLPILLYCVPIDWLNGQHSVCLVKNILGVECFGCGITRAVISAVQCHFTAAFHYNKLIVIVFPLLVYAWRKLAITYWQKTKH